MCSPVKYGHYGDHGGCAEVWTSSTMLSAASFIIYIISILCVSSCICQWIPHAGMVSVTCGLNGTLCTLQSNARLVANQSVTCDELTTSVDDVHFLYLEGCNMSEVERWLVAFPFVHNLTVHTYNNHEDSLPNNLAALSNLEILDLSSCGLSIIPQALLCGLANITAINLNRNKFSASLWHKSNDSCPSLTESLDLSYNQLTVLGNGTFSVLHKLRILSLKRNRLSRVHLDSLLGMNRLQKLDLSDNQITTLPFHFFKHNNELRELYLDNNSLSVLSHGLFSNLHQLSVLSLSNNLLSLPDTAEDLGAMSRLSVLDLSHNQIRVISGTMFQHLVSLRILYLNNNRIGSIATTAFSFLTNLHTLAMSSNRLKTLNAFTFSGLHALNYLSLSHNELENLSADWLHNCTSLQNLKLKGNRLKTFPESLSTLSKLKHLDVSNNYLKVLGHSTLKQLVSLKISNNYFRNLTKGSFHAFPALKTLDLSHNSLQSVEKGVLDEIPHLRSVILNDNLLTDVSSMFRALPHLTSLNVSRNKIKWFDYALIPSELKVLDLHDNQLDVLGNYFRLEVVMQLQFLDASYNHLTEVNPASFPRSLEVIKLNQNKIHTVAPFSFFRNVYLQLVDLRNNKLNRLDVNVFRVNSNSTEDLPQFFIAGNPFVCDCRMEWLSWKSSPNNTTFTFPRVADLSEIQCSAPVPRGQVTISVSRASSFLCPYTSHCFALCHCCEFDACDCEMVCPEGCSCLSDPTWNVNIVDCGHQGLSGVPSAVPMDVTVLYIDGNDMFNLHDHSFIGRKVMKTLYMNHSNIQVIHNRTFSGLSNLQVLHLEENVLSVLVGTEFAYVPHLREIYLSFNRLRTIGNDTFMNLQHLRILHLDHNQIISLQVWKLKHNVYLNDIRLGNNPWSCNCDYLENFHNWMSHHKSSIKDVGEVHCFVNGRKEVRGEKLLHSNVSTCSFYFPLRALPVPHMEQYVWIILVASSLVLLIFISAVFTIYHKQIKIWLYTKYGIRLFKKNLTAVPREKLYDIFVTYSKEDEAFILQILAAELECGDPSYKTCLRYRDLPPPFAEEAVSEAISCSSRTLVVISEQFLKSELCRFELKTTYRESECNRELVAVLLDKSAITELEWDVRKCLLHSRVISWRDKRFWEKLRYALPVQELRHNRKYVTHSSPVHHLC